MMVGLAALAGCQGVSPLSNRIAVGEEPIVVLVGTGTDGYIDLFAGSPGGGVLHRLTFTRDREASPAMHPGGATVAFLRHGAQGADSTTWVVVMNLVNAAEREAALPATLGRVSRVGWSHDGTWLYIRGSAGLAATPAPPARLEVRMLAATDPDHAAADSATTILLGDPAFARVVPCAGAPLACIEVDTLPPQRLDVPLDGVFPWGGDSVATIVRDEVRVRWLGGGRPRLVAWTATPLGLREGSYWAPGLSFPTSAPPAPEGMSR